MAAAASSPLPVPVRWNTGVNWSAHRATGAGPETKPIAARLSKERRQEGAGAAEEEALAYVEVAARVEGGKRRGAERALIGRRPRARSGTAE